MLRKKSNQNDKDDDDGGDGDGDGAQLISSLGNFKQKICDNQQQWCFLYHDCTCVAATTCHSSKGSSLWREV